MKSLEAIANEKPVMCRLICNISKEKVLSFKDIVNNSHFDFQTVDGETVDVSDIDDWPNKWPLNRTYTYGFLNYSSDARIANTKTQDKLLNVVFRQFQRTVSKIKFDPHRDPSTKPNFRFEWSSNLETFNNNERVLAQAYLPTNDPLHSQWSGLIQINDLWEWAVYGKDGAQFLLQALTHELFHSLGYKHDPHDSSSVLWWSANGVVLFNPRDRTRLWNGYGRRWLSEWLTRNLNKRLLNGYDFD